MKYILGVLGLIILAILAIALIGRTGDSNQQVGTQVVKLSDYVDKDVTLTHTTQGRVVGDDAFKSIRISVDSSERKVDVLTGYSGTVEKSQSFANTSDAFTVFVLALERAGFTRERSTSEKDERGVCPQGNRYIYQLDEADEEISRLWSTSCGGNQGTFGGSSQVVRRLFQDQITDYNRFVNDIRL